MISVPVPFDIPKAQKQSARGSDGNGEDGDQKLTFDQTSPERMQIKDINRLQSTLDHYDKLERDINQKDAKNFTIPANPNTQDANLKKLGQGGPPKPPKSGKNHEGDTNWSNKNLPEDNDNNFADTENQGKTFDSPKHVVMSFGAEDGVEMLSRNGGVSSVKKDTGVESSPTPPVFSE